MGLENAFVSVEKLYISYIWVLNTQNIQRLVTYFTKNSSKKTKKRFFDGNGMNSVSCKDTKHGAQLTLIDKNVI